MNNLFTLLALALLLVSCNHSQETRPRLLITTDIGGDPDDQQSLVRLLLYANDLKIEGLVASASGTMKELSVEIVKPELIKEIVQAYGSVLPNLQKHDGRYPSMEYLMSTIKAGNPKRGIQFIGEGNSTEGSNWILEKVDESDQVLNVAIWGGQSDLAQGLWQVRNDRSDENYEAFISKLRVHDISDQDSLFGWFKAQHPTLFYIRNRASDTQDKRLAVYRGMYLDGNMELTSLEWLKENVIEHHGPLGALYPQKTWTDPNPHSAMKEGDTPSWFYFLENGLNRASQPAFGGWGGRFDKGEGNYYYDAIDTYMGTSSARMTVARWREDFQNEFAARMDWCVNEVADANHAPIAVIDGDNSKEMMMLRVKAGEAITLDASGSSDPDNDRLRFQWMVYPEPGNLHQEISIESEGSTTTMTMPELGEDEEVHLILKVSDDGIPPLASYRRVIIRH